MHRFLLFILLIYAQLNAIAQKSEQLLQTDSMVKEKVTGSFKSSRVIMSHSLKMLPKGVLDFRILHRFGKLNSGAYEFFGLDNATIRLSLDYAFKNKLTVGVGRATHKKELDGFIKYQVLQQSKGTKKNPLSLIFITGSTVNTLKYADPERNDNFNSRLSYYTQILAGSKFSEKFSLQLSPIFIHQNYTENNFPNNVFALGAGSRLKLSKRISFNIDYYYVFDKKSSSLYHPLSVGFDIETGGHVFQLHFTNAIGMNERAFLTETSNNWAKGDVQFGFNISRAFQIGNKN